VTALLIASALVIIALHFGAAPGLFDVFGG
jgi:hypothetical protein